MNSHRVLRCALAEREWLIARHLIEVLNVHLSGNYGEYFQSVHSKCEHYDEEMSCLHYATVHGAPLDLVELIWKKQPPQDLSRYAPHDWGLNEDFEVIRFEVLEFLLQKGLNPNKICSYGYPALLDLALGTFINDACLKEAIQYSFLYLKYGANLYLKFDYEHEEGCTILNIIKVNNKIYEEDQELEEWVINRYFHDLLLHTWTLMVLLQGRLKGQCPLSLLPVDVYMYLRQFFM